MPLSLYFQFVFNWEKARPGLLAGLVLMLYSPYRFMLDGMRQSDARYLGLTPAHYATIVLFAAGIYLVFIRKPKPEDFVWAKDTDRIAAEQAAKAAKNADMAKTKLDP